MATQNLSAQTMKDNPSFDRQCERIEMARLVWNHILDPIMSVSELIRSYDESKGINFYMEEISDVLRLLIIGGHTELRLYCTSGGSASHISGDILEKYIKDWSELTKVDEEEE